MRFSKVSGALAAVCLTAACACGMVACTNGGSASSSASSSASTGAVAATVNGVEISEDTITNYIERARVSYGLTDKDAWAQYLASVGTTPADLRASVLDSYINEELVKKYAAELVGAIDTETIDSYYNNMRSKYDSDEAWEEALGRVGYTSQSYRDFIEVQLLTQKVEAYFNENAQVTDEDLLEAANQYKVYFSGSKRSSHILFDASDRETAESVLARVKSGELDFAAAAQEYSKDGSAANGGDVGWDALTSFVTEYQTAVDGLAVGEISDIVESKYGLHIIKVTEEFIAPETITSMDQVPEAFRERLSTMAASNKASNDYKAWTESLHDKADITINEIPADVPYNVSLEGLVSASSADAAASGSAESASAEAASSGASGSASSADASSSAESSSASSSSGSAQ